MFVLVTVKVAKTHANAILEVLWFAMIISRISGFRMVWLVGAWVMPIQTSLAHILDFID